MTNPNDAVGTPAAYDGRSSVKSFNDTTGAFTRGIISGWNCSPKAGMTVQIGGDGSNRDIAVAEDNAGNRTTINNISESPIDITIAGAPSTGNRIDLIVAYVDANPQGDGSTPDNPSAVGFITVSGTAASTPSAPDDTAIRTAITSDGATGASAYYVVLASIYVGTSITTIGSGAITQGTASTTAIDASSVSDGSITTAKLATNAVSTGKVADDAITDAKMDWSNMDTLFYKPGDKVILNGNNTTTDFVSPAHATTGGSELCTFITLPKRLDNITSATVDVCFCLARGVSGYLTGLGTPGADILPLCSSIVCNINKAYGGIGIVFHKSSGTWATNNTVATIQAINLTITLA